MTRRPIVAGLVLGLAIPTVAASSAAAEGVRAGPVAATAFAAGPGAATARLCAPDSGLAATFVVPPPPFRARVTTVRQMTVPATASVTATFHHPLRLYRVTFQVVIGNAALPAGHRYTQFAYVGQPVPSGRWCFVAGGSGP